MKLYRKDGSPTTANERAGELFTLLADKPDGMTTPQMSKKTGWPVHRVENAIRALRLILMDDEITVTCEPQGQGESWVYRLVGTVHDGTWWLAYRVGSVEAQLETMYAVTSSLMNASDGRTPPGKKIRLISSTVRFLLEQLREIDNFGETRASV